MAKKDENNTEKTEKVVIDIIRGRMPVALVWVIRFKLEGNDAELARMVRTTPGKINDIKKNRNFGYIGEDTKFTQEQIDAAKERAEKLEGDDKSKVMDALNAMEPATEEEAAKMEEARKSSRKPRGKTAETEPAPSGGESDESGDSAGDGDADDDLDGLLD